MPSYSFSHSPKTDLRINAIDLVVLLFSIYRGQQDPAVGFEDADHTLAEFVKSLDRPLWINGKILESALWSAHLLYEKGKFWHPKGTSFKSWVASLIGEKLTFDTKYHIIMRSDGEPFTQ